MKNAGKSLIVVAGILGLAVSSVNAEFWLNQDVEIDGSVQWVGDANSETGMWGYLTTTRVSTEQAHSGTKSFRVARGSESRGSVQGYTDLGTFGTGASSEKIFTVSLWVYRRSGAGNIITFGDTATTWGTTGNAYVRTDGVVQLDIGGTYASFSSGTTVATNTWTQLEFAYDLTAGSYGEVTATLNGTELSTLSLTNNFSLATADRVTFNPQGATGDTIYFDDIQLAVPNPPRIGLFIISSAGILLFRRSAVR